MVQQIIALTIVILAAFYLLYKWKFQKIIATHKQKNTVKPSCGSGCGYCPSSDSKKVKKFRIH
jgi:hypothetical protein